MFSVAAFAIAAVVLAVVLGSSGMRRLSLLVIGAAAVVLLLLIVDGTVTLPEIEESIRTWANRAAGLFDDTGEVPVPYR